MEICAHSLHLAAGTHEPHSRRPPADSAQLALRDKKIRSGSENFTRRLDRARERAHSFTFLLRAATVELYRDHRSENTGKTFPFDMEPAPGPRLLAFYGLRGQHENNRGTH